MAGASPRSSTHHRNRLLWLAFYDVIKVDPASMKPQVVLEEDGPPMGYGTVALKVGDRVFLEVQPLRFRGLEV